MHIICGLTTYQHGKLRELHVNDTHMLSAAPTRAKGTGAKVKTARGRRDSATQTTKTIPRERATGMVANYLPGDGRTEAETSDGADDTRDSTREFTCEACGRSWDTQQGLAGHGPSTCEGDDGDDLSESADSEPEAPEIDGIDPTHLKAREIGTHVHNASGSRLLGTVVQASRDADFTPADDDALDTAAAKSLIRRKNGGKGLFKQVFGECSHDECEYGRNGFHADACKKHGGDDGEEAKHVARMVEAAENGEIDLQADAHPGEFAVEGVDEAVDALESDASDDADDTDEREADDEPDESETGGSEPEPSENGEITVTIDGREVTGTPEDVRKLL